MTEWNYLQVVLSNGDLDRVSGEFWLLGTQGIEETSLGGDQVQLRAYFDGRSDIRKLADQFQSFCREAGIELFTLQVRIEKDQDWAKRFNQQLKPFRVGKRIYILPSHDKTHVPSSRVPIRIGPGMAFGTGTHETTQLCLEQLETHLKSGGTVIDVGTGSGILAIAAVRLGAARAIGFDIDPVAIEVAQANVRRNRCQSRVQLIEGEVTVRRSVRCDLLVANLTFELLDEKIADFSRLLLPDGVMILSGILVAQAAQLLDKHPVLAQHLQVRKQKGEWSCLVVHSPLK
ncbi:MAG: 50S ribosomal protein L11 methyltransferase [Acidobacteriota bacterium]